MTGCRWFALSSFFVSHKNPSFNSIFPVWLRIQSTDEKARILQFVETLFNSLHSIGSNNEPSAALCAVGGMDQRSLRGAAGEGAAIVQETPRRIHRPFLTSLLLFVPYCFQYYQRFHSFIPSTPLSPLRFSSLTRAMCLSDTHSHSCTHVHTQINMLTWSHTLITTLQGARTTQLHAQTHTHSHTLTAGMCPRGSAVAPVAAWCSISRTTHYYSNTPLFKCSNVLSILLNQLYLPPEGKQFMNTLLLWGNEMNFGWTHSNIIFFLFSYNVYEAFAHFVRLYFCYLCLMKQNGAPSEAAQHSVAVFDSNTDSIHNTQKCTVISPTASATSGIV